MGWVPYVRPVLGFTEGLSLGPRSGPMQANFLCTISCPLALGRSELGQGMNRFLDRAADSTWPNVVCWSRLVVVNHIAIMMAFLDFRTHFG